MTVTVEVPPELETKFEQAARLQGRDMPTFLVESARRQLRTDILSGAESELFIKINQLLNPEIRAERDALLAVQEYREFTESELSRFAELSDVIEMDNAERWRSIGELARIRGLSLKEMAAELEIPIR